MWTEREKYISEHNEIKEYLEAMDAFHDYRIGNIEVADNYVILTIEEIVPAKHIADTAGQIWDFKFEEVTSLKMNNDCVGAFFIDEITMEDGAIIFSCTNGCIQIKAAHIQIGIPSVISLTILRLQRYIPTVSLPEQLSLCPMKLSSTERYLTSGA